MAAPPVLLVHGFASSFRHNWQETGWADLLADAGREVIGVDLLGHGDAPKPHDTEAYADLESRVRDVLPAGGPVDAVGFSLGARVLLTLASELPDRFGRIVVGGVGANLFRGHSGGDAVARAIEGQDPPDSQHGIARLFAQFAAGSGNDPKALAACIRRPEQAMTAEQLGRITCPVLVVLGDQDFAGPADPLVEALPDARLVTLRNVDHFATPKDFKFLDAGLEFLDALPA
jgi:pimeloyl-ACP methyl ester carboxylesterase